MCVVALWLWHANLAGSGAGQVRKRGAQGAPAPTKLLQPPTRVTARISRSAHQQLTHDIAVARGSAVDTTVAAPIPSAGPIEQRVVPGATSRPATTDPPQAPQAPPAGPALSKEYIRKQIQEVRPLVAECYENAYPSGSRPSGDLMLHFTLEGEPGVGGIVSASAVAGGSLAGNPELSRCVTETLYTLAFEPPAAGGRVEVHYPFHFASGDDAGTFAPP